MYDIKAPLIAFNKSISLASNINNVLSERKISRYVFFINIECLILFPRLSSYAYVCSLHGYDLIYIITEIVLSDKYDRPTKCDNIPCELMQHGQKLLPTHRYKQAYRILEPYTPVIWRILYTQGRVVLLRIWDGLTKLLSA